MERYISHRASARCFGLGLFPNLALKMSIKIDPLAIFSGFTFASSSNASESKTSTSAFESKTSTSAFGSGIKFGDAGSSSEKPSIFGGTTTSKFVGGTFSFGSKETMGMKPFSFATSGAASASTSDSKSGGEKGSDSAGWS